jgi:putative inorganic carbon (hco3(-)) transporter
LSPTLTTPRAPEPRRAWTPSDRPQSEGGWLFGVLVLLVGGSLGGLAALAARLPPAYALALVGAALAPFVVMVVGHPRRLLLAVVMLDLPFALDVNFFYRPDAAALNALGGVNVSLSLLALCGLYVLWGLRTVARVGRLPPGSILNGCVPLALYTALVVTSAVVAADVVLASFEIALRVQLFLLFVYLVGTVRSHGDVKYIMALLMAGLALQGLVMIGVRLVGSSIDVGPFTARIDQSGRVGGTLGGANSAAGYLTLLLAPAATMLLTPVSRRLKLLAAAALAFGIPALVFTGSRGGWLAFALSIVIVGLGGLRRGFVRPPVLLAGAALGILFGLAMFGTIAERITQDDNGSAAGRLPLMQIAFHLISQRPLFGVGANNFALAMRDYADTGGLALRWTSVVHNQFLLVWSEVGAVGLTAFLAFLAHTLLRARDCTLGGDRLTGPLALGLAAGIAGHMTHMLGDFFNGRLHVQLLYISAALIIAMSAMRKTTHDTGRSVTAPVRPAGR